MSRQELEAARLEDAIHDRATRRRQARLLTKELAWLFETTSDVEWFL